MDVFIFFYEKDEGYLQLSSIDLSSNDYNMRMRKQQSFSNVALKTPIL